MGQVKKVVIGTRRSKLALAQTEEVARMLRKVEPQLKIEIKEIVTTGDKVLDVALSKIGGKGIFTKEIETALLEREIDLAVHSAKDLPAEFTAGLVLGAVTARINPADAFISKDGGKLAQLPPGAKVGTSSLRRRAQIMAMRPDLKVEDLRGNIDTRLRKLAETDLDGIVLAAAGLLRLGWGQKITEFLPPEEFLPAACQGALGVELREDDLPLRQLVAELNDASTFQALEAERGLLNSLQGGCQVPLGAYTKIEGETMQLFGKVLSLDGTRVVEAAMRGPLGYGRELGIALGQRLKAQGAEEILREIRGGQD